MNLSDAIKTLQIGKRKKPPRQLFTEWGEALLAHEGDTPLPEHPRPQMARERWMNLNGWWEYAIVPTGSPCKEMDGRIRVPFSPESALSGVGRTLMPGEDLWYQRILEIPALPEKGRILLHFGAVDERCEVWWNGQIVGSHRNGYLPFTFDVTDVCRPGENALRLLVRDDTDKGAACRGKQRLKSGGMFYHAQSGIWQTVFLEFVPDHYITNLFVTPDLPGCSVRFSVIMNEPEDIDLSLEGELYHRGKEEFSGQDADWDSTKRLNFHAERPVMRGYTHSFTVALKDLRPWSPEEPTLYPFTLKAGADCVKGYFAMRQFGTGRDENGHPCLTLNGRPYYLHGVLDQGYWPESLMTPPAYEAFEYDIRQMKRLGFNMLRKHEKMESAMWYALCDRIGMVVWQDMVHGGRRINPLLQTYLPTLFPSIGAHVRDHHYRLLGRQDKKARLEFEDDLIGMIQALYNVPSIAIWGLFNEGWGQFDALRLTQVIKTVDPGRLVDHASGWFEQGGGDIKSVHNYFRPLTVQTEERPFVLSEYGGFTCPIPGHLMSEESYGYHTYTPKDFPAAFHALMETIETLKKEGLAADVYTQLSDIEEEINGLLTFDRKHCKVE